MRHGSVLLLSMFVSTWSGACSLDPQAKSDSDLEIWADDGTKDDSSTKPTVVGEIGFNRTLDGSWTKNRGFAGYTFLATAGQHATVTLTGADDIDTYLLLYGPKRDNGRYGYAIARNDDYGDTYSSQIANFVLPKDGEYLLVATTYYNMLRGSRHRETGKFTLRLEYGCAATSDCAGLPAALRCPGAYQCEAVSCVYHCGQPPRNSCEQAGGTCEPFYYGAKCPDGTSTPSDPAISCQRLGAMCCMPVPKVPTVSTDKTSYAEGEPVQIRFEPNGAEVYLGGPDLARPWWVERLTDSGTWEHLQTSIPMGCYHRGTCDDGGEFCIDPPWGAPCEQVTAARNVTWERGYWDSQSCPNGSQLYQTLVAGPGTYRVIHHYDLTAQCGEGAETAPAVFDLR
jgi:hypothetical protein